MKEPAVKRWLSLANRWLDTWTGQLYLACASAAVYVNAYQHHGARPGANTTYPMGWLGWWDHGQYQKCAAALAHGSLTPDTYWYPLGYPALGALFYRWMPEHAFVIPDLVLVAGTALLFFRIAKKFVLPIEAVLLIAFFILCYHGLLADTLVIPWNTIPTHFLSYSIILLAGLGPVVKKRLLLAAFCVGLMYLCRPGDAFCLALVLGLAILRLPSWADRIRIGIGSFLIIIAFCAIVLSINWAVFHQWTTPYDKVVAGTGFGAYPFGVKLFSLVVDARPLFWDTETTLFSHLPWLLLIIPGITWLLCRRSFETLGILLGIGATYVIYFQFNDFWPGNLFRYRLVHYLAWTFPILALFAYLGIREAWRTRPGRWSYGLMIAVGVGAALLTLRLDVYGKISAPVPLIGEIDANPAQPVDWIVFDNPETSPKFSNGKQELPYFTGFVQPQPTKGLLTLLSKEAREKTIGYDASASGPIQEVRFGRLAWHFQSIGKVLRPLLRRLTAAPARVIAIGKESGVDIAGPAGTPDGQPDEVIELELAGDTLQAIKVWTLQADDGSAHWSSEPTPEHWWLIKVLPGERQPSKDRGSVRLCLPEFGQLDGARPATVRGLDESGRLLLELAIPTARKP